jgi:YesN/AraC family two-component response regulator
MTRDLLSRHLERVFTNVKTAKNGLEGLQMYQDNKPDVVITDLSMPAMSGFEMIKNIQAEDAEAKVLVTTAFREEVGNLRVDGIIYKPVSMDDIIKAIDKLTG